MHAGEAEQRQRPACKGDKFLHATVETTTPAEKQNEKCTPAKRRTAAASVQKETNSSTPSSKRSRRRRNRMKNARRRGEQRQRPACKGDKFLAGTVETTMPAEK
ncbi:MAG: hypothetical protein ACLR23_06340 [Clostridia bacterium]